MVGRQLLKGPEGVWHGEQNGLATGTMPDGPWLCESLSHQGTDRAIVQSRQDKVVPIEPLAGERNEQVTCSNFAGICAQPSDTLLADTVVGLGQQASTGDLLNLIDHK
jgi:hypothetical protein